MLCVGLDRENTQKTGAEKMKLEVVIIRRMEAKQRK
jgi:hypothetical protein